MSHQDQQLRGSPPPGPPPPGRPEAHPLAPPERSTGKADVDVVSLHGPTASYMAQVGDSGE